MNNVDVPDDVKILWAGLRKVWEKAGSPDPKDIDRRAAKMGLKLPSSTVQGWFDNSTVPRWGQLQVFLTVVNVDVKTDRSWKTLHDQAQTADRKAKTQRRVQRRAKASTTAPPAPGAPAPTDLRRVVEPVRPLGRAASAVAGRSPSRPARTRVFGVLIVVVLLLTNVSAAGSTSTRSDRTSTAFEADFRAHAVHHAGHPSYFDLFDDSDDGRSAVLLIKVNGGEITTRWNKDGLGSHRRIDLPVPGARIEYQVCTGQFKIRKIYTERCGNWTIVNTGR